MEAILMFLGIMAVVFGYGYFRYVVKANNPVENYPLDKVSAVKMAADNCSPKEKQKRMVMGYYDKDENHPY